MGDKMSDNEEAGEDDLIGRLIEDLTSAFANSDAPATKKDIAMVQASLISMIDTVSSLYITLSLNPLTPECEAATERYRSNRARTFKLVRTAIRELVEHQRQSIENGRQ